MLYFQQQKKRHDLDLKPQSAVFRVSVRQIGYSEILLNLPIARVETQMVLKSRVLFICQHNSGRSQIAEAYLKALYGSHFQIESAGIDPAEEINPIVVKVMAEEDIDLSEKRPKGVFDLFKQGKCYEHVISVCQDRDAQCSIFPGTAKRWDWPFPDPGQVTGSETEKLNEVRRIRDMIKSWLLNPPKGAINFRKLIKK